MLYVQFIKLFVVFQGKTKGTKLDLFQIKFVPSRAYACLEDHKITTVLEMHKYFNKIKSNCLVYFFSVLKIQ